MTMTEDGPSDIDGTGGNYSTAVEHYRAAGWRGVLPLPPLAKMPPPRGCTGGDGRWPSAADVMDWTLNFPPDANVALRLPEDVLGLDIDQYGSKAGYDHLLDAAHEHELPPLPPTWRSSARNHPSGILFYRIPAGMKFRGEAVRDVETIQHHHRFAVVWPSVHPKERTSYLWWAPVGDSGTCVLSNRVPSPDDFPELPAEWCAFLEDLAPPALVDKRPLPEARRESEWSQAVWLAYVRAEEELANGEQGARHEVARDWALKLLRLEQGGSAGATAALDQLGSTFAALVQPDRPSLEEAAAEWRRIVEGGRALAASTKTQASALLEVERSSFADLMGAAGTGSADAPSVTMESSQGPDASGAASIADRLRGSLLDSAAVMALPPPEWLLDGYLVRDTLALLYAPPAAGKTFLAVDWALSVARGAWWHKREVPQGGARVLYVIAEGVAGMGKRLKAWQTHNKVADPSLGQPVIWLPRAVNLSDPREAMALAEVAEEVAPSLVVIDTLARCTAGAEENSARDMGIVVDRLDDIRRVTGATVLVVHHAGKDAAAGARGSSALRAAVDTELRLTLSDDVVTLKVTKQKDSAEGSPRSLVRLPVDDSCVLVPAESVQTSDAEGLSDGAMESLRALESIKVPGGIPSSQWLDSANIAPRTFYRHRSALVDAGLVVNVGSVRAPRYLPADALEVEGNAI